METEFSNARPGARHTLVLPLDSTRPISAQIPLPSDPNRLPFAEAARLRGFKAEVGEILEVFATDDSRAQHLILVGLGGESDTNRCERAGAALAARRSKIDERLVLDLSKQSITEAQVADFLLGVALRAWHFDYRTKPSSDEHPLGRLLIVNAPPGAAAEWRRRQAVLNGVAFARQLVTEPGNLLYPETFVERCRLLETYGVEIVVLGPVEMQALGMGALLGVAQGSGREPRLIAMRWRGAEADAIALIGKGVTFDAGGISLKPAAGMEGMKWDMGGAAAVAGTILTLAIRRAKADVIGICGLVENMPDGKAQRPGDVVTSLSGQTIEIINTDAEGRLVLADAITWAQNHYKVRTIVDVATLTGAMIVSLGHEFGGCFANDDELADQLLSSGRNSGDRLWRLPLDADYDKLIKSEIADMRNLGPPAAGAITAAHFIQRFVGEGVKWAHLDIAGMAWADEDGRTWKKGATGFGVRLFNQFISDHWEVETGIGSPSEGHG